MTTEAVVKVLHLGIAEAGKKQRRIPHYGFQMLHGLANTLISESRTVKRQICVVFSHSVCDTF